MRICYLAPADSPHMEKWTERIAAYGHEVHIISLRDGNLPSATVHCLGMNTNRYVSDFRKISYLTTAPEVRRIIRELNPDVLHAHRASSYGLIAALSCDRPYYLSVWGSDVYDFPKKTPLHHIAIRYALDSAEWLMSTSVAMAQEASHYTDKSFEITPFGVDMSLFSPDKRIRAGEDGRFVIGTVKALEPRYGIDVLLKGAARLCEVRPDIPLEVRIAGRGSQREELERLAFELAISDRVTWLGFISQEQAALEWANMDVAVVMSESESESFGVSSVEAQASGIPVIYSDIPGLMEAAGGAKTGICLPRGDWRGVTDELIRLWDDPKKRESLGAAGRSYVHRAYEIGDCFDSIEKIYRTNARR